MSNEIKVSVIIPSYNSEQYIDECVRSVMNQSLKDIEIITIDAMSEDNTITILNELKDLDSRIQIIESDIRSYGHQMNIGFENATGKYLAIVESDDFIDEHMLEDLFNLAENNDADICKTTFYYYYDESKCVINNEKEDLKDVKSTFEVKEYPLFLKGHPSIWSAIYKNSFIKENNIKFVEAEGAGWVDNPFLHETGILAKKILYRHKPYYYYRQTNINSSSNNLRDITIPLKRIIESLEILDKYNYHDEEVLKAVYERVFVYMNGVFRRKEQFNENKEEALQYIQKMLLMLDENIVKKLSRDMQDNYYKYISPLPSFNLNDSDINLSNKDLKLLVKENDYLYDEIRTYKSNNSKLKKKNKKIQNEINLIKESKSYRLCNFLVSPIRKLKKIFK